MKDMCVGGGLSEITRDVRDTSFPVLNKALATGKSSYATVLMVVEMDQSIKSIELLH